LQPAKWSHVWKYENIGIPLYTQNNNIMNAEKVTHGLEVVRSKGDYVVGRTGTIVMIDNQKNRAQVQWNEGPSTWVSFSAIEPTSIPYEIKPGAYDRKTGRVTNPKYIRL
jgi:hypothetical protein